MASPIKLVEPEQDDSVIEILEAVLKNARDGKFMSVAIAYVYKDARTGNCRSMLPLIASQLGSIDFLRDRIIREAREEYE